MESRILQLVRFLVVAAFLVSLGKRYSFVYQGFGDVPCAWSALVFTEFPPKPRAWTHNGLAAFLRPGWAATRRSTPVSTGSPLTFSVPYLKLVSMRSEERRVGKNSITRMS